MCVCETEREERDEKEVRERYRLTGMKRKREETLSLNDEKGIESKRERKSECVVSQRWGKCVYVCWGDGGIFIDRKAHTSTCMSPM